MTSTLMARRELGSVFSGSLSDLIDSRNDDCLSYGVCIYYLTLSTLIASFFNSSTNLFLSNSFRSLFLANSCMARKRTGLKYCYDSRDCCERLDRLPGLISPPLCLGYCGFLIALVGPKLDGSLSFALWTLRLDPRADLDLKSSFVMGLLSSTIAPSGL